METAVLQKSETILTPPLVWCEVIRRDKRRVYICSPLRGDIAGNMRRAKDYARFAYDCGCLPIVPHLYFPQFLNDDIEAERADALLWGLDAIKDCGELWVFGDRITDGMRAERNMAQRLRIQVRYFTENMEERENGD
jgi:hypothetical protein